MTNESEIHEDPPSEFVPQSAYNLLKDPLGPLNRKPIWVNGLLNPLLQTQIFKSALIDPTGFVSGLNSQIAGLNQFVNIMKPSVLQKQLFPQLNRDIITQLTRSIPKFSPLIDPVLVEQFRNHFQLKGPENFRNLKVEQRIRLVLLSFKHGFGSVEALPLSVIEELLDLDTDSFESVDEILERSSTEIIGHCLTSARRWEEEVLGDISDHAALLGEAAVALQAGHVSSSQALCTAIWDSRLTVGWGRRAVSKIKETSGNFDSIEGDETMNQIYRKASLIPAVVVYAADKSGSSYSRNGTIHYASRKQFTMVNALRALTIASGVIAFSGKKS